MEFLQYEELDEGEKVVIDITETSPEKINTPSIKSKVNLEKDITLCVQISTKVDDKGTQQRVENVKTSLAPSPAKEPVSTKASIVESRKFVTEPKLVSKKINYLKSEVYLRNNIFEHTMYSKT